MTKPVSPLPDEALEQHVIILGKTGSGKSSKSRVLVEELQRRGEAVCILDTKGEWWGLKSSADGKRAGLPFVIFGGAHADVPITARAGAELAELILTGNRPAIIDVRSFTIRERTRFFIDFAGRAYTCTTGKRWLVLAEVHNYAPKGRVLSPEAGEMLHWATKLAGEGRGLGLNLICDSQRPQKVHNDILGSCETLIACRALHPAERDAVAEWIEGCGDRESGKRVLEGLAKMPRTDAWCWSPEIDFGPVQVTWPMFATYDSFKPQAVRTERLPGWATVDLDETRARLEKVVQEAQANDPGRLRQRITDLERELAEANRRKKLGPSAEDLEAARSGGYQEGYAKGAAVERERVRQLLDQTRRVLLERIEGTLGDGWFETPITMPQRSRKDPGSYRVKTGVKPTAEDPELAFGRAPIKGPEGGGNGLSLAQRILDALAELEQLGAKAPSRELVAFMSGYTHTGTKSFRAAVAQLSENEHVESPQPGLLALTTQGRQQANATHAPRTSEELQERVVGMLGGATGKILAELLECYPDPRTRESLAKSTGYTHTGTKSFRAALSRLHELGFVNYEFGTVAASKVLFLEGR